MLYIVWARGRQAEEHKGALLGGIESGLPPVRPPALMGFLRGRARQARVTRIPSFRVVTDKTFPDQPHVTESIHVPYIIKYRDHDVDLKKRVPIDTTTDISPSSPSPLFTPTLKCNMPDNIDRQTSRGASSAPS